MAATWTLSTIRTYARERSGFGSTQISDSAIDLIINRIYRSVVPSENESMSIEGFSTVTTVLSTGEYDIDEEILSVRDPITLNDGDGDAVTNLKFYRDPTEFFAIYPEDASADNGVPVAVLLYGNENSTGTVKDNQLYVRPVPDGVYTIKYASSTRPQILSADSDPPVDDDSGYYIGIKTALDIIDTKAGGISERKIDLQDDLKFYRGNLNTKKIKQMTNMRSLSGF